MTQATETPTLPDLKIRMTRGKILVLQDPAETITEAGIENPSAERPRRGVVVAMGDPEIHEFTGEDIPSEVDVGDRIVWAFNPLTAIELEGTEYLVMDDADISVILLE
jgi:chaperonin GroES